MRCEPGRHGFSVGSPRFLGSIRPSNFQRGKLISYGVEADRLDVVPTPSRPLPGSRAGEWSPASRSVLFAGRVAPGKGLEVYLAAATMCPEMSFQVAGTWAERDNEPGRRRRTCTTLGDSAQPSWRRRCEHHSLWSYPARAMKACLWWCSRPWPWGSRLWRPATAAWQKWCRTVSTAACSGLAIPTTWGRALRGLRGSPERARSLAENAMRYAQSELSVARFFERTMGVYERAIRGR